MLIQLNPDPVTYCIKRTHYHIFIYNPRNEQTNEIITFEINEWIWCPDYEIVKQVWFLGNLIPRFYNNQHSRRSSKGKKQKTKTESAKMTQL